MRKINKILFIMFVVAMILFFDVNKSISQVTDIDRNTDLPKNGFVKIVVYDMLGREIETLVNEKQTAGTYEVKFDGSKLASGMYFYTLTAGDFKETKKLILLK